MCLTVFFHIQMTLRLEVLWYFGSQIHTMVIMVIFSPWEMINTYPKSKTVLPISTDNTDYLIDYVACNPAFPLRTQDT